MQYGEGTSVNQGIPYVPHFYVSMVLQQEKESSFAPISYHGL